MRILYGVPSEGMGHATRSKVVLQELEKEHDIRIVTSDRAFTYLSEIFPGKVFQIEGFHLAYRKGVVSKYKTFTQTLKEGPSNLKTNFKKFAEVHRSFKPDVVISDFESFSFFFAKTHKVPLISLDNMQVLSRCQLDIPVPAHQENDFKLAKQIVRMKVPRCSAYLVSGFFQPEVIKDKTTLVPPILRTEILQAKQDVVQGKHILLYQQSIKEKELLKLLHQLPNEEFKVYGFNKEESHSNVNFKAFSEKGFIADLISAKAVMANAGYSLLSECVYLGKPVLAMPIPGQFEQYVNAAYIEKLGYGRCFEEVNADALKAFLYDRASYEKHLSSYRQDGNKVLFDMLNLRLSGIGELH